MNKIFTTYCDEKDGCERCSYKKMKDEVPYCDLNGIHIYKFKDNCPRQEVAE